MSHVRRHAPALLISVGATITTIGIVYGRPWLTIGIGIILVGVIGFAARAVVQRVNATIRSEIHDHRSRYVTTEVELDHVIDRAVDQERARHKVIAQRRKGHLTLIQGGAAAAIAWLWDRAREHTGATVSVAAMAGLAATTGPTIVESLDQVPTETVTENPPPPAIELTPEPRPAFIDTAQTADVGEPEPQPTVTTVTATPTPAPEPWTPTPGPTTTPTTTPTPMPTPTPTRGRTTEPPAAPTQSPELADGGRSVGHDQPRPCAAHDHAAKLPQWQTTETTDGDDSDC